MQKRPYFLLNLLLVISLLVVSSLACSDEEENPGTDTSPAESASEPTKKPTRTPKTSSANTNDSSQAEWLVMLYMDADDEVLEKDIFTDLNEAEVVGSTEEVIIVSQLDRYKGGFKGDGNWNATRRYVVTQDDNLDSLASEYEDLGETDMSQEETLVDFAVWAMENYPAKKYALMLSDHGAGWVGGFWDPSPSGDSDAHMDLTNIESALAQILDRTGVEKLELVGFDACLMSQLEVYTGLVPYANYAVASQETEPALGWAYSSFLQHLVDDPSMTGETLSRTIVATYIDEDIRIVDDGQRAKYVEELYGEKSNLTAAKVAKDVFADVTLTAVDLSAIPQVNEELNTFSIKMSQLNKKSWVTKARTHARSFTSVFGDDSPKSYIDLASFVKVLKKEVDQEKFSTATLPLLEAIDQAVIYERHGPKKQGSAGIAIYFPNSTLYEEDTSSAEAYTTAAKAFAQESLWDNYLAFHYTGEEMPETNDRIAAVPEKGMKIESPGAEALKIEEITLSANETSNDNPVVLTTRVTGSQIGFIYTFVGYYDQEQNGLIVMDMDFLGADETREIDGVYYPDWGEDGFVEIEYEWPPVVFSISNGSESHIALFSPQDYGAADEDSTYEVDGIYTFSESGEQRRAFAQFSAGELVGMYAFMNMDGTGAPAEITLQEGDQFTILQELISDDISTVEGPALTIGEDLLFWEEAAAPAGQYILGFIAEDLNGNTYEEYVPVTVIE